MKEILLKMMLTTGAFAPFRLAHRSQSLILTYHRFSAKPESRKISALAFAEHLSYLKKYYNIVPLERIAESVSTSARGSKLAAITIDDGYRDAYEIAYPILREYDLPATVFIVTDFLDGKNWVWTDKIRYVTMNTVFDEMNLIINNRRIQLKLDRAEARHEAATLLNSQLKKLPDDEKEKSIQKIALDLKVEIPKVPPAEYAPISWEQAREIDTNGISIGSHTVTHPILINVDSSRLNFELNASRLRIQEKLGRKEETFCYPDGAYNTKIKEAVARAGYRCAVITRHGFNDSYSDLFALRRFHDEPDLARFAQTTSGFEQVKQLVRKAVGASELANE